MSVFHSFCPLHFQSKKMWSAIQSDLMEFVATVQTDAKKTLVNVLGSEERRVRMFSGAFLLLIYCVYISAMKHNLKIDNLRICGSHLARRQGI